jgi:hypothetical protein
MIVCLNKPTASHYLHADPDDGGRTIFLNGGKQSPFVHGDSTRSASTETQSGGTALRGNVVEILTGKRIYYRGFRGSKQMMILVHYLEIHHNRMHHMSTGVIVYSWSWIILLVYLNSD